MFADTDARAASGASPTSLRSMFQITTGDDWAAVVRPVTDANPAAYLFFVVYIVLATYIVLNLFIAVAVEALERETDEDLDELEETMDHSTTAILASLEELKGQVSALEARLGSGPR